MLGAYGHRDWQDLSEFVVHFTKGSDKDGYDAIISILWQRILKRGPKPFGAARGQAPADSQRAVCFSEIPLGFLSRLVERRKSPYGIAFRKRFVLDTGGGPVWYVERGSPPHAALRRLMGATGSAGPESDAWAVWNLTPYVDVTSDPAAPYTYDFRWEREWRTTTDVAFEVDDVAFLFIPEALHGNAAKFFREAVDENRGPGYFCPFVDPLWPIEKVAAALAAKP